MNLSSLTLRIIYPASKEKIPLLGQRIQDLQNMGVKVLFDPLCLNFSEENAATSIELRKKSLLSALLEPQEQGSRQPSHPQRLRTR